MASWAAAGPTAKTAISSAAALKAFIFALSISGSIWRVAVFKSIAPNAFLVQRTSR
jgi:hypothetical protein